MFAYIKKHHRWIIGIIVAVLLVPFGIYLQQKSKGPTETKKYYYIVRSDAEETGNLEVADCWTRSLSSNRFDAYRCSNQHYIYDPCFKKSNFDNSIIACPGSPYEDEQLFIFSSDMENPKMPEILQEEKGEIKPWYIILTNGRECRFLTGASGIVADKRMDYSCEKNEGIFLQLPIEKSKGLLKIRCYDPEKHVLELCTIKEAWF